MCAPVRVWLVTVCVQEPVLRAYTRFSGRMPPKQAAEAAAAASEGDERRKLCDVLRDASRKIHDLSNTMVNARLVVSKHGAWLWLGCGTSCQQCVAKCTCPCSFVLSSTLAACNQAEVMVCSQLAACKVLCRAWG